MYNEYLPDSRSDIMHTLLEKQALEPLKSAEYNHLWVLCHSLLDTLRKKGRLPRPMFIKQRNAIWVQLVQLIQRTSTINTPQQYFYDKKQKEREHKRKNRLPIDEDDNNEDISYGILDNTIMMENASEYALYVLSKLEEFRQINPLSPSKNLDYKRSGV